jgi:hypothetical protein
MSPSPPPPRARQDRRVSPTLVIGAIALVGSGVFLLYAITLRSKDQVPLLISGAVVLGLVFAALALTGAVGAYRTAAQNRSGAALVNALGGGIAAVIAFGLFAFAIVMGLVWTA